MSRSRVLILLGLILLMTVPASVALAQQVQGSGTAIITDGLSPSDTITIAMTGVTPPAEGTAYEGWLVSDDESVKLSLGVFTVRTGGAINHIFSSPTGENFVQRYSRFVVTVEPSPDPDPANPTTTAAFSDVLAAGVRTNVRLLLVATPGDAANGELALLRRELDLAITHANLARNSTTLATVRQHLEHTVNIINGGTPQDLDGNGTPQNPGDGVGVIGHADNAASQVSAASAAAPNDPLVVPGARDFRTNNENLLMWAREARDKALDGLSRTDINVAKIDIGPGVDSVISWLEVARSGFDADADGTIESVTGEGGLNQAYVQAQRVASYSLNVAAVTPGDGGPVVGDELIPVAARFALIFGVAFLGLGGVLLFRSRRSRRASA
ncbi:MAG: hypothetical protein L0177_17010 [Chloroflexi bacterium]|nr:hypothetical protein [Chloroflexota bacterium]